MEFCLLPQLFNNKIRKLRQFFKQTPKETNKTKQKMKWQEILKYSISFSYKSNSGPGWG